MRLFWFQAAIRIVTMIGKATEKNGCWKTVAFMIQL